MDFDKEYERLSRDRSLLFNPLTIKNLIKETQEMVTSTQNAEKEINSTMKGKLSFFLLDFFFFV
jgi:hypothetical protein